MANSTRRANNRSGKRTQGPPPRTARRPVQRPARQRASRAWLKSVQHDPRGILLPLRAYLGATFLYAGFSKIADRSFLDGTSPTSMHATLLAVKAQSPIGGLLGPVADHSFAFGVLMALGEVAVGTGVLLGLFGRVAAAGGIIISLSLFLTVSWNASPWYTGADLVYAFALTPLLLGGAGPLSVDDWLAETRRHDTGPDPVMADRTRRVVLAGITGIGALVGVGVASLFRGTRTSAVRFSHRGGTAAPVSGGSSSAPSATAPGPSGSSGHSSGAAKGTKILAANAVPVGGAATATDPKTGDDIYVLQLKPGVYTALDRACPHQGCPVSFVSAADGFQCPCHGSTFDPSGAVTQGPAVTGLAKIPITRSGSDILRT